MPAQVVPISKKGLFTMAQSTMKWFDASMPTNVILRKEIRSQPNPEFSPRRDRALFQRGKSLRHLRGTSEAAYLRQLISALNKAESTVALRGKLDMYPLKITSIDSADSSRIV